MQTAQPDERPERSRDWLAGGGDMGARVRDLDWSETALGALGAWPQSLRTTVSTCLNSRLPILIWWGPEQVEIYNDAYRPLLGSKHPRSLGQRGADCWPEAWSVLEPLLKGVVSEGKTRWSENQRLEIDRNGFLEECYFTFSYSPIKLGLGRIGGVSCAATETTAHVLGERRLRTLSAIAEQSADATTVDEACRAVVAALAENAADLPFALIYIVDDSGRPPRLAAATGIWGVDDFGRDSAELSARGDWPLNTVLDSGTALIVEGEAFQHAVGSAGAGVPPTRALLVPISLAGEASPVGVLVVGLSPHLPAHDEYRSFLGLVSSQIAAAIASARALEAVELRAALFAEADRAKTDFFSNVSHEFRTPLTLMLGPTEDALASPDRSLRGSDLEMVHRNELRLLKLVNTLLDFSRIEAGRSEVLFELTDIATLTTDVAATFRSAFERAGLAFDVRCEVIDRDVFVDRGMWEKIVLNLLSNAFKFTFEGSVSTTLRCRDGQVELAVRDTGVGIPRVFERFYRIEGTLSRSHEGSGIGLALVRDLARLHSGEISVQNNERSGTTFTISVPTGDAHLPANRVRASQETRAAVKHAGPFVTEALRWLPGGTPRRSRPPPASYPSEDLVPLAIAPLQARIIVADDNSDMREYLTRLLGRHWQVDAVADGAQALASARANVPDLVLTDVMMPNLDGFGLIRALRDDPRTVLVPVVMLSARAGEGPRLAGLAAGADDYLIKPFAAKELMARVSIHLELGRLRRAAELERRRLYSLFEQAPAGIAVLRGPDHVFELANARYEQIMQRTGLVGRSLVSAMPELDGQAVLKILERVYRTGERYVGHEFLIRLRRNPDAELEDFFFDFVYEPFLSIGGVVEGITCVALEVSDRVRGARDRERLVADREQLLLRERAARREAEAGSRAKDEFLAMLGHELRNPLAPIVTALDLLRLRGNDPAEREHTIIERQVKHLTTLVDDLLDISRITQGKIELKRERLEMSAVIARAIELQSPLLEQRRHTLVVDVPEHGVLVLVDATRFAQVISNLLGNAAKYTEAGGRIVISAALLAGEVTLVVSDNGIGIAEQTLPHVFDIFMQERQASDRAAGGLGLGLTIVRSLVEMHGGSVSACSAGSGAGSSFTIRMPGATGGDEALGEPTIVKEPRFVLRAARRVLVVDDNSDAAELLARVMHELGCETRIAYDGPSALALAETFRPELALLDIGLPVMDGYELARHLRQRPDAGPIRLIAVTGYGQRSDVERALAAGFDAHLTKPVDIDLLEAVLASMEAGSSAGPFQPLQP
jgi:signal transduction histidine kinase/FixJ family two-component response regulator